MTCDDEKLRASLTLPSERIWNVHHSGPIGAIGLGVGYDHRSDQTKRNERHEVIRMEVLEFKKASTPIPPLLYGEIVQRRQIHDIP